MLTKMLTSALIAGAAAGLIAALLQLFFVQPVLLHAELYEGGERTHFAAASGHDHGAGAAEGHDHAAPAEGHDHAAPVEALAAEGHAAPGIGFDAPRDGLSILFSIVVYSGYGLLLVAAFALSEARGHTVSAREGLLWGVAGFVAVQMAPAFGLAPELPGMAAADINARALWWIMTVLLSAGGLWLVAFGRNWTVWALALVMLALPHVVGAPHPADFTGPTPPELAAQFAGRALGVGLAAWAVLGLFATTLWTRARAA
ncbi:CbtA family protein [Gemmobacter serpentinus]|uniref:CbtA family protein n=1 Tax=Gemmobacter serpentinus TaxID=2652247 RepID=UPI00124DC294|nr:CbtA family protein [Gemmobacter serpentinus]